jgi:ABC-2 type transport system permease protein
MLKAQLMVQIRGLPGRILRGVPGKSGKKQNPGTKALTGLAIVYVLGAAGFSLGAYFHMLLDALVPLDLAWFYFALAGLTAFVFSFLGSVFMAQGSLFAAKDNELLLSLPIKPMTILASRTAMLYITAAMMQAFVLLPALTVWWIFGDATARGVALFVLAGTLLPLPVLALSILLGWLLSLLSARLRRKNLVIILISLAFSAIWIAGYIKLMNSMGDLLARGQEIAQAVQATVPPAYHYGQAAQGSFTGLLVFALYCLVPFALVMGLVAINYPRLLTTQHGAPRVAYKGGGMKAGSRMKALTVRDMQRFFTSPIYLMNTGIGLIFMLALPVLLLADPGSLTALTARLGLSDTWLGAMAAAVLTGLAASVFISAPSISLEGRALWIIQSLPVKPIEALLAKALAHVLISLGPIVVSGIAMGMILKLDAWMWIMCLVLPLSAAVFSAFLGLVINLRFPKMDWRTETEPVKQSMSTFLTMTLGFLSAMALGMLYVFVLAERMTTAAYLPLCAALYSAMSLLIYLHLKKNADEAFLDLSEV